MVETVVGGLVLPLVMMVAKRHYEAQPKKFEEALVFGLLGLGGCGGGIYLMTVLYDRMHEFDSLTHLVLFVVNAWIVILGAIALFVAWATVTTKDPYAGGG